MNTRWLLGLALLSSCTAASADDEDLPIKRLEWLIGSWQTHDEQVDGPYEETGRRDCNWALDDQYIVCRGTGTNLQGTTREYVWYFNYNVMEQRFELTSLYGNWPRKVLFEIEVSEDNHQLELSSFVFTEEGLTAGSRQTVAYNGTDQYVWKNFNGSPDSKTGKPVVGFIDTANRLAP